MTDFKLYSECFVCKVKRLFIRKRQIVLKQINRKVTSRELMCTPCFKGILRDQERGILQ